MTTLCETFRQQAFWTWRQLSNAHQYRAHLGEESLTDFNLLKIISHHSNVIETTTFNKPQEGENGADWEWWLTNSDRNRWIGFRIQAKVINVKRNKFEELHYKKKDGTYQVHRLCDQTLHLSYHCIPLYCLYTHWPLDPAVQLKWRCGSYAETPESYGCSLVDAFHVRDSIKIANACDLTVLSNYMTPWHCLVCCRGWGGTDLPTRAFRVWQSIIRRPERQGAYEFQVINEPPAHVRQLQENRLTEPPDEYLRTITIFREETPS